ncbi:Lysophospholipase L1 [Actinosynnema pretiosum]|nr:Lysophospholipase L1 [Actinosynnema pretiosum]
MCAGLVTPLVSALLMLVSPAATHPRVMALGDSITGSPGCWRALLAGELGGTGHADVDFVGTQPATDCGGAPSPAHEGHGGFRAVGIVVENRLPGWLTRARPDVVLMHLGTNDVLAGAGAGAVLDAYTALLGQMRRANPVVKLLVAQLIPLAPPACPDCPGRVVELNGAIPGWARAHSTPRSPVVVVDQWTGFDPATDTHDGVHPSPAGERKLARRWYPPLVAALAGADGPRAQSLVGVGSGLCVDSPDDTADGDADTAADTTSGSAVDTTADTTADAAPDSGGSGTTGSGTAGSGTTGSGTAGIGAGGSGTTGSGTAGRAAPGGRAPGSAGQGAGSAVPVEVASAVRLWDCRDVAGQRFTAATTGEIRLGARCLQAVAPELPVLLAACDGGVDQRWAFAGDGQLVGSGHCLDAHGSGSANGTPVVLWRCNGQPNQRWDRF